jgi:hypothetical protein
MGAHSNYISVESDAKTVMYLIIAAIIGTILYFAFKLIKGLIKRHYYKQFKVEQYRIDQYKQIKARKERAYQNTVNNFFYNRIEEDIEEISDVSKASSKQAKNLISLYHEV